MKFELGSLRFSFAHYIVNTEPIELKLRQYSFVIDIYWLPEFDRDPSPPPYYFLQILHGPLVDRHLTSIVMKCFQTFLDQFQFAYKANRSIDYAIGLGLFKVWTSLANFWTSQILIIVDFYL